MKDSFEPGMQFNAKVTLLAEGAHGSLTKGVVKHFGLRKGIGANEQTYGMGVEEVWRIDPSKHRGLATQLENVWRELDISYV